MTNSTCATQERLLKKNKNNPPLQPYLSPCTLGVEQSSRQGAPAVGPARGVRTDGVSANNTFLSSILVLTRHHFCSSSATLCSVLEPEPESSRLSSISRPLASSWLYTSSCAFSWPYSSCKRGSTEALEKAGAQKGAAARCNSR